MIDHYRDFYTLPYWRDRKLENMNSIFAIQGTLIVAVASNEGLIIAADRRTTATNNGALGTKTKIIQVNPKVAFTANNTSTFYTSNPATGQVTKEFDADDIVSDYWQNKNFENNQEFWRGLAQKLRVEFNTFFRRMNPDHRPPSGDPPHNGLFQITHFFIENGVIGNFELLFCYENQDPPIISFGRASYPAEKFIDVDPCVVGDIETYNEIKDGNDQQFDYIRNDPFMRRFLFENPNAATISAQDAELFCRTIIKVTNERSPKVGDTYDSAIIPFQGRFLWLTQNKSVNDPDPLTINKAPPSKTKEQRKQWKRIKKKRR